jgi:Ca2+-binding RTX toxin-like protein
VTYTLSANVEKLVLTGSANINGTGNEMANVLTGNAGANVLSSGGGADQMDGGGGADTLNGATGADSLTGGAGDDRLVGGADADLYVGGSGRDTFVFGKGQTGGDRVQDFSKGDHIEFQGFSAGSTLARVAGSSTDWTITDHDTGVSEVFKLLNAYTLKGSDYLFT